MIKSIFKFLRKLGSKIPVELVFGLLALSSALDKDWTATLIFAFPALVTLFFRLLSKNQN
jgi:hypothetical protein